MIKTTVISVGLAMLYAGTAAGARLHDVEDASPDSHVVFGSVDFYDEGELKRKKRPVLYLLSPSGSKLDSYKTSKLEDGAFYWGLEPGRYMLVGAVFPDGGTSTLHVGAEFEVPESGDDIYIGTIEIRYTPLGSTLEIADHYEHVSGLFNKRFPDRAGNTTNGTLEEPQIGNFASVSNPCTPNWGLTCEDKHLGVIPLTPSGKKLPGLWPDADSLTPLFSWDPSTSEGVTYDLVLYEGVLAAANLYMRGHIATYVEGLEKAEWRPDEPLEPGGRYFWSVRLRKGNDVTAWSTQGFFIFALVASASGSGQWFHFQAPKS